VSILEIVQAEARVCPDDAGRPRRVAPRGQDGAGATRYAFHDAKGRSVPIYGPSIAYNAYRKRWTLNGVERDPKGTPSHLGEVWYAEADATTGPWRGAVRVATHPRYSFYNPRQHAFLDADAGRVVYLEGIYTQTFAGNPTPTPPYEYNQLLYRLDLADVRLKAAR
jgi:hypothetical protein